jgi:hypothetical protein
MTKERGDMDHSFLDARPMRREQNLAVREVEGEVVAYDLDSHDAHCLTLRPRGCGRRATGLATVGSC